LGRAVGEGGFCSVSIVLSIDLDEVYDTSETQAKIRKTFARAANEGGRSNGGSYVIKALRHDLAPEEYSKGVLDLAIEAEHLKVLQHKNIICMRAMGNCDPRESRFFVILDRLVATLELKFNYWRKIAEENTGVWWPIVGYCCAKAHMLHHMWKERIGAAYNVAQAIQYLHHLKIIYRDLVRAHKVD
jgi:serine/threonine protein kinase